jgi:hypothetical protein
MISADPLDWFLILFSFSVLGIAAFIIRTYAVKYYDIKAGIHAIHALIELIDESLKDDKVTKEEFTALVKRCLAVLSDFL